MLSLIDRASVSLALADADLDPDLRALIALRVWELHIGQSLPLGMDLRVFAVQGGDTAEVINAALGFTITGDDAEEPGYDWIEDHGLWFEIAYGLNGGPLTRVFVENGPATELGIHHLCLSHFWADDRGGDL